MLADKMPEDAIQRCTCKVSALGPRLQKSSAFRCCCTVLGRAWLALGTSSRARAGTLTQEVDNHATLISLQLLWVASTIM